jgi:hypothetical protein
MKLLNHATYWPHATRSEGTKGILEHKSVNQDEHWKIMFKPILRKLVGFEQRKD